MSFLDDDNKKEENNEEGQKIKIGDKEFSQEELQERLTKFEEISQFAENHGGLDKLKESFGRKGDTIGKLEKELEELKTKIRADEEPPTPDEKKQQVELENAINLLKELAPKAGIMTRDDYQRERTVEKLLNKTNKMAKEIDGSDGRPKFVVEEVLEHMKETGIKDPVKAYKDKYETELDTWRAEQLKSGKGGMMVNDKPTGAGAKEPKEVKVTKGNLRSLLRESLFGATE